MIHWVSCYRTTTCSVPYSSKLAPVSHVLILTWTYQRKVTHAQVETNSMMKVGLITVCVDMLMCSPPLPPVFPNTPPGWSLDGENREQVSYMPASTGGVIMPPVPPRSFPPGTFCFYLTHERYRLLKIYIHISYWTLLFTCCRRLCVMFSPRELPSAGHFLMHCDAFHHQNSDPPPALPVRSLRKVQPSEKQHVKSWQQQFLLLGTSVQCFQIWRGQR